MPFTSINRAVEEAITDYLVSYCSSSLGALNMTASFYTGLGNVADLQAPAVMTSVIDAKTLLPDMNTKIGDMMVAIEVKEMTADTPSGSLGLLALTVYNAMVAPDVVSKIKSTNSWGFSPFGVYEADLPKEFRHEDAIYNTTIFRVVGAITGSA
jgi:hypothetical protein